MHFFLIKDCRLKYFFPQGLPFETYSSDISKAELSYLATYWTGYSWCYHTVTGKVDISFSIMVGATASCHCVQQALHSPANRRHAHSRQAVSFETLLFFEQARMRLLLFQRTRFFGLEGLS
jgi:hypothetical protein